MNTQVTVGIFKLGPIHASVIYQFPWIRWIHWNSVLFREKSNKRLVSLFLQSKIWDINDPVDEIVATSVHKCSIIIFV